MLELFLSIQMERGCSLPVMTAQPVSGMQLLVNNCSIYQNIGDGSGLLYLVQMADYWLLLAGIKQYDYGIFLVVNACML